MAAARTVALELTDEELCARVAARDRTAFDLLAERYQARAFKLALSILGGEADARDVSQEAFIRVYQSAGTFDGRARFSTWFHRILVNLCIDHQRRDRWWRRLVPIGEARGDRDEPAFDPPSSQPGPDETAIQRQSILRLREALKRLSPKQRAAIVLQTDEDMSSREIAVILGCSEATARVHLHRAVVELKRILGKQTAGEK